MNRWLMFTMALAVTAPTAAMEAPITSGEFARRAEPMLRKNMASLMLSSEARALGRMLGETARSVRARQEADVAAGRKPATCVPPKGKAKIDARGLVQYLKSLPTAEQAKPFQSGVTSYLAIKYPCPA